MKLQVLRFLSQQKSAARPGQGSNKRAVLCFLQGSRKMHMVNAALLTARPNKRKHLLIERGITLSRRNFRESSWRKKATENIIILPVGSFCWPTLVRRRMLNPRRRRKRWYQLLNFFLNSSSSSGVSVSARPPRA